MRVQELGKLDAPVLVFGGPYSNLEATRALIAAAEQLGVSPEHMICTGDVVAYCGQPSETVAEIRALGCPVVAGNCEIQLATNQMDCGCGFGTGTTCDLLSAGWFAHADRQVVAQDRAWMAELPDIVTFSHHGCHCAVIHGGISDVSRFIWPTSHRDDFMHEINLLRKEVGDVDTVFCGHSGLSFKRKVDGVDWVNAGAIGMPQNDGTPDTRFVSLIDRHVKIHRMTYDHDAAHAAIQRAGLQQGYDAALLTGFWPSEEVLPEELRRSTLASG